MEPVVEGLVVRLDDVRTLSPRLSQVWDRLEANGVPVHLQVIPADLDSTAARRLIERAEHCHVAVAVHQHGYSHANHGDDARRFEFADCRKTRDQRLDILRGRALLQEHCQALFEPIFTPPWDRLGPSTLGILAESGFVAVSMIERRSAPTHPKLRNIAMTTDPVDWRPRPVHQSWEKTLHEIQDTLACKGRAGLELHHEIMDDSEVRGLDRILSRLAATGTHWPTMLEVAMGQST